MSPERRLSLRLPVDLAAIWRRKGRNIDVRVHDISAEGLFLLTPQTIDVAHVMDLAVALPSATIRFVAVARFCGDSKWGPGVGARIHAIERHDRDRWLRFYRERLDRAARAFPAVAALFPSPA